MTSVPQDTLIHIQTAYLCDLKANFLLAFSSRLSGKVHLYSIFTQVTEVALTSQDQLDSCIIHQVVALYTFFYNNFTCFFS